MMTGGVGVFMSIITLTDNLPLVNFCAVSVLSGVFSVVRFVDLETDGLSFFDCNGAAADMSVDSRTFCQET